MKVVTPTHFRNNSSEVFNEVQRSGCVEIKSQNRPDMILCTKEKINSAVIREKKSDK